MDDDATVRSIVERAVDGEGWIISQFTDATEAWERAGEVVPDLVVLNADLAKGWHLCAQLKRKYSRVPVVLLSSKANQDVFNNHQKLETRADAYHKLPEELDRLEITVAYYASHGLEPDDDDDAGESQQGSELVEVLRLARREVKGLSVRLKAALEDGAAQAQEVARLHGVLEAAELERDANGTRLRIAESAIQDLQGELEATARAHQEVVAAHDAELATFRAADFELRRELDAARQHEARVVTLEQAAAGRETELAELWAALEAADASADAARQGERERAERAGALELEVAARDRELGELRVARGAAEPERQAALERERAAYEELERADAAIGEERAALEVRCISLEQELRETEELLNESELARMAVQRRADEAQGQVQAAYAAAQTAAAALEQANGAGAVALEQLTAALEDKRVEAEGLAAERRALEEALAGARAAEAAASERAETVERAWAGLNARVERHAAVLKVKKDEAERLEKEKTELEAALATSRKLMKEYGQEVARRKEENAELSGAVEAAQAELDVAKAEVESASVRITLLRDEVASYARLEAAIPALAERAEEHIETVHGVLARAIERGAFFEARVAGLEQLRGALEEAARLTGGAVDQLGASLSDEAPAAPDVPERPDLRAIITGDPGDVEPGE